MTATTVGYGTADALARIWHVRQLTDTLPEAHELDPALRHILGPVTDPAAILQHLRDQLDQLWSLLTEDYDADNDLDEVPEADWLRYSFPDGQQEIEYQYSITVDRLVHDIESYIRMAREWHAQTGTAA